MKKIKLEIHQNVCAKCKNEFISYHLAPYEYNIVLFETVELKTIFVSPDDDPVWKEVRDIAVRIGATMRMTEDQILSLSDKAMAKTIDEDKGGPYFAWGDIPCPHCGAKDRSYSGPDDPIKFVVVELIAATHAKWDALSEGNKVKEIEGIATDKKEEK